MNSLGVVYVISTVPWLFACTSGRWFRLLSLHFRSRCRVCFQQAQALDRPEATGTSDSVAFDTLEGEVHDRQAVGEEHNRTEDRLVEGTLAACRTVDKPICSILVSKS